MKTILVDAIGALVIKGEGIDRPLFELLETYPEQKIILTNANDEQMEQFGLNDMPYEVFTLKHDPEKTDPRYYTVMLEHYGLNAEDVVYFEHSPEAVASARSVGITTYVYDEIAKDLKSLKVFLDRELCS